jgi:uncharacterized membrane protein
LPHPPPPVRGRERAAAGAAPGVHAHRVIFIDLARALAVLFMLYGHAVSALLAPMYRAGTWFDVWQFQRGLTSSLFLLLSGFAFSVATTRHWSSHLRLGWPVLKRTRRFLTFAALGYALHFPVSRFADLRYATDDRWRTFLAVDVLQLIGVTFLGVQLLVLIARVRWRFTALALLLSAVLVGATPWIWMVDWDRALPLWAASYFSPATGSQFPLFPWAAYVLLGAALGQLYGHLGAATLARYTYFSLLLPGTGLVIAGAAIRPLAPALFGGGPFTFVPPEVLLRAGTCLLILGVVAHGSRFLTRLPHVFGAVAQETLLIYFVHLCIVYGSVWNTGLVQLYGEALAPVQVLAVVVVLILAMTALAWQWNWLKHTSPRAARWISLGAAALLVLPLL